MHFSQKSASAGGGVADAGAETVIPVSGEPYALAVAPHGQTLYITNSDGDR
jgi:hypothetical protein